MSLENLLFGIIFVAAILLLAWLAAKWFISRRMAQTEQLLESSTGTIQQAEEAALYLHNGLGTLPFPTLKKQIDQKLEEVETEYTDLAQKLYDLRRPFEPHHDPLLKSGWSRLNYQWQRYHEAAILGAPTQELKQQLPVLDDLLRKPKYLVALYRRELRATIQTSLKATQKLVDEGIQGDALASTIRNLEDLKSCLDQRDFSFSSWSLPGEVSWESTKSAWQTLEAIDTPAHELSKEVRHWEDRCQEIKPKLQEMDRKLDVLNHCLDQAPSSICDLSAARDLCHKAQQLKEVGHSPKVETLDQIAVDIQQVIDRTEAQIRQVEAVKADYYHLEADIMAIYTWLTRINRELEQLQRTVGNTRLYSEGRVEYERIREILKKEIGPITATRTIAELKGHLALSERLKEQAGVLAKRCEGYL